MIALNKTVRIDWPENDLHGKRGLVVGHVGTRDGFWTVEVDGWTVMIAADKLVPVRPVTAWVDETEPQSAPQSDPRCPSCGSVNPELCRRVGHINESRLQGAPPRTCECNRPGGCESGRSCMCPCHTR